MVQLNDVSATGGRRTERSRVAMMEMSSARRTLKPRETGKAQAGQGTEEPTAHLGRSAAQISGSAQSDIPKQRSEQLRPAQVLNCVEAARASTQIREARDQEEARQNPTGRGKKKEEEEEEEKEAQEKAKKEANATKGAEALAKKKRKEEEAKKKKRKEAEEKAKKRKEVEENKKKEAVEKKRKLVEVKEKREAEIKKREEEKNAEEKNAEEKARKDAEVKAKKEAEAKVWTDLKEKAKKTVEEKAKEAEAKTQKDAEEKAKKNAEEKARKDVEEQARKTAKEKARKGEEEKAKKRAEETTRKNAEERVRKEAENRAKKEAEDEAKKETEAKAEKEAEDKTRKEAEGKPDKGENKKAKCAKKMIRDALAEEYVPAPIIGTNRQKEERIREERKEERAQGWHAQAQGNWKGRPRVAQRFATELDMAEKPFPKGMRERKLTSTSGGSQKKRGRDYEMSPIRRSAEGAQRGSLEEKVEDARRMLLHATEIFWAKKI
uniref:MIF4G domain-containing protein n=1 Tax=Globodera pallida TaxID=36090 RepID=A0A183C5J1_GLOPA